MDIKYYTDENDVSPLEKKPRRNSKSFYGG